jgi:hypothetical protein
VTAIALLHFTLSIYEYECILQLCTADDKAMIATTEGIVFFDTNMRFAKPNNGGLVEWVRAKFGENGLFKEGFTHFGLAKTGDEQYRFACFDARTLKDKTKLD